jgi:hypothetical protein
MSGLSQLPYEVPSLRKASIEDLFGCTVDDMHKQHNQNHNEEYIQKINVITVIEKE